MRSLMLGLLCLLFIGAAAPKWNPRVLRVQVFWASLDTSGKPPQIVSVEGSFVLDHISERFEKAANVTFDWRGFREVSKFAAARYEAVRVEDSKLKMQKAWLYYKNHMKRYRRHSDVRLMLAPKVDGYTWGLTFVKCGGEAVAGIGDDLVRTEETIAHELARALNAKSDAPGTCTLMDEGILYCPLPAKFSEQSKHDIKKCVAKLVKK